VIAKNITDIKVIIFFIKRPFQYDVMPRFCEDVQLCFSLDLFAANNYLDCFFS
jgi:hypothetical protein